MPKTSGSFQKGHKYCRPKEGGFFKRKHSEETIQKIKNKKIGQKYPNRKSPPPLTEEHRNNIKKGNTGLKRTGLALLHISNTNKKPWTEERRRKMRESKIGRNNPMYGKHPLKETLQKRRESMLLNPNRKFKDTGIELKVESELQKRNINYQKQVSLCKVALVDFYLPEYKIIIQCDGCYWHNCPICKKKANWKRDNKKDIQQDAVLISSGYKIYRFWEHEINESTEKCIDRLLI